MTDPMGAVCPRCALYLSVRGCRPERCNNPEGAAELERLRAAGFGASPERQCLGTQFGPCDEMTENSHGRCRDCDIEYSLEAQCCEYCGVWLYNEEVGEKVLGLPRNEHARMTVCPFVAL